MLPLSNSMLIALSPAPPSKWMPTSAAVRPVAVVNDALSIAPVAPPVNTGRPATGDSEMVSVSSPPPPSTTIESA